MQLILETLSTTEPLPILQEAIQQWEELNYELTSPGRGMVSEKITNQKSMWLLFAGELKWSCVR